MLSSYLIFLTYAFILLLFFIDVTIDFFVRGVIISFLGWIVTYLAYLKSHFYRKLKVPSGKRKYRYYDDDCGIFGFIILAILLIVIIFVPAYYITTQLPFKATDREIAIRNEPARRQIEEQKRKREKEVEKIDFWKI